MLADRTNGGRRPTGSTLFRTLVTWFSLIAILSCIAIGSLTYYQRSQGIRTQMYNQLETLRDEKLKSIGHWVEEKTRDLEVASSNAGVIDLCQAYVAGMTFDRDRAMAIVTALQKAYYYHAVFITDREGNVIVTTEAPRAATVH